jgi:phenylacetate-CoA ligase
MQQTRYFIPHEETLSASDLQALQRRKLGEMLARVRATNPFYRRKYANLVFDPAKDPLAALPLLTRQELEHDQVEHPPFGTNRTEPFEHYRRFHQTSGSSGRPMRWLDTDESWGWFKKVWGILFTAAGVTRDDRFVFPFSFGPFIGFWAAFEGAAAMGNLVIPAGGMTTTARLKLIIENRATVLCCTPTYALHMAEVAAKEGFDIAGSAVRAIVVAGEPGGSIPATRGAIERSWNARLFDHTGMTELGPVGFECLENPGGVHLAESECIPEVLDPQTLQPVADGDVGELIITNLGRVACPVIRYRTGDLVRLARGRCACGRSFARMDGGILSRRDDMFIVRGNNVFPSALEAIIRRVPEVAEFRVEAYDVGALTEIAIELEPTPAAADSRSLQQLSEQVSRMIQDTLSFRAAVRTVPCGSLPRFEMKARRFVRRREKPQNA